MSKAPFETFSVHCDCRPGPIKRNIIIIITTELPSLNKWHQALLAAASRHESGTNYYDEVLVRKFVKIHHIELLREMFGIASSAADMDEDGSPTMQQIRAQRLKEKSKANDDYTAQHEVAASLRLIAEQNALEVEERKSRHEEWAKQIQEEMDDKNMERNTSNYTPMRLAIKRGEPSNASSNGLNKAMKDRDENDNHKKGLKNAKDIDLRKQSEKIVNGYTELALEAY
ncbi:hypothetical protein D8674_029180 [Pyrus ussuriensis x Pyrus communis]|uniref:Uncharacterized protein n=1 Tax=Pyrus ussuriensis x Pyrus communis TaxID=2448454 RepID=A0A5N5I1D5_9ROSA|nr:hypothetical protein D8674_029180 [Pyrus ussuriensis x Pyrus communis]